MTRLVAIVLAGAGAVMIVTVAKADTAGLSVASVSLVEGGSTVQQHITVDEGTSDAVQVSVLNPPSGLAAAARASGSDASCQSQGYYTWVCAPYSVWQTGIDVVYQAPASDDTAQTGTAFSVNAVDLESGASATGTATITAEADLQVTGPSSPDTGTSALTALVTNNGPSTATSVSLVISGLGDITTPTLPDGCTRAYAAVTCTYASIPVNGFEQPVIRFGSGVGTITPALSVTAATSDPNPANNTSSAGSWMIDLPTGTAPPTAVSPTAKPSASMTTTRAVATTTAAHASVPPVTLPTSTATRGAASDGVQTMAMSSGSPSKALLILIVGLVLAGGSVAYLLRQQVVRAGPGASGPSHAAPPYSGPSHAAPNHTAPTHARPGHNGRPVLEHDRPRSDELL